MNKHAYANFVCRSCLYQLQQSSFKRNVSAGGLCSQAWIKHLNLVMEQSSEVKAKMPIGKLMQQRLNECVANDLGDHDWTDVALKLK